MSEKPAPFSIRNLTDSDLLECGRVFLTVFGPDGCGEPWTEETSLQYVTENAFNKEFCFVAEVDQNIVGFLLGFPVIKETGTDLFISAIGVLSAHQGAGIGKTLWQEAAKRAKTRGFNDVRLLGNQKFLSYDWYKRMGMNETGWVELGMKL